MTIPRVWHTATLLTNGKVLIAGGVQTIADQKGDYIDLVTPTAEIYDPATGTFSLTTPMMYNHACQQSVLFNSGQVLVVGGSDANRTGDTHRELFNPQTASFFPAASFPAQGDNTCAGAVATVLTDGKDLLDLEDGTAQVYNRIPSTP